jgi:plastocyanin
MHEYIITCRSREELVDLYDDMETPGGSLYIPDRAVELVHRRAISRNTHYLLTEEEAEEIRNDPRVIACERTPEDLGLIPDVLWEQTGDFEKTTGTLDSYDKNWGLWRTVNGDTYWGGVDIPQTFDFTTTASGSTDWTLFGNDRNGAVGANDPTITFYVGDTINFNLNSVSASHPFFIRDSSGGSNVSTPPATGQGSTGNATVSWTPNTAGSYVYECGSHPNMMGTIQVNEVVSPWGSDATTEISNETIKTTASGRNVDVVIVDTHVNPNHPEFAVNVDGTGGSRLNQFNWFSYSSALGYSTPATYTYSTSGASPNENHGTHVAGTAVGNTQGWARDANIYNMAFGSTLSGVSGWTNYLWDYLRYFHLNKDINPETGRRNTTITNHSWGYSKGTYSAFLSNITSIRYRGVVTNTNVKADLEDNGIPVPGGSYLYKVPSRVASVDADIADAIADGVIIISSAGNSYWNCDVSGGPDYDNYYVNSGSTVYHSRGSTPGSTDDVICVGSMGSKAAEYKSNFSNWGDRVDIWASGSDIVSAVFDYASSSGYGSRVADPRNGSFWLASINGTSMSGPQVAGVIACLAETEQNLTQAEALQYLIETSKANCGDDGGTINHSPYETFGSTSNNRYLFIARKRQESGSLQPTLFKNRNPDTAGVKYPRRNTRVTLRA